MRFAGNVIWFVLGGFIPSAIWAIGAMIFYVTVIGRPIARAAWEMAIMSAMPFGKDTIYIRDLDEKESCIQVYSEETIYFILNVIWVFFFGWVLFVLYLLGGIASCLTLIGIPFGLQAFKLAAISLWPFGMRVVEKEVAVLVRQRSAEKRLAKYKSS